MLFCAQLGLEGDFDSFFSLFCPNGYERDALYVFTPDVMARMVDADGVRDVEFVDNRLLLYAPMDAFYTPERLVRAAELVAFLADKIDRRTWFYGDLDRADTATDDPFRRAQLTTAGSGAFTIGDRGRRVRTGLTGRQRIGVTAVVVVVVAAAAYWVSMVVAALTGSG